MVRILALAAGLLALSALSAQALDSSLSGQANAAFLAANAKRPGVVVEPSGVQHRAIHTGYGKRPRASDLVTVNYRGTLINGQFFDGNDPSTPVQFTVNKLIPGWTEALQLMREGDEWELVIPANLAYGARGAPGAIPPNQTLVFDLTLISVSPPKEPEKGSQSQ